MRLTALVLLIASAFGAVSAASTEKPLAIWDYPRVWPRHSQLRQELIAALQRGDIPAMERICRAGVALIPGDATWHYNLACALAYREKPDAALDELEKAVDFGFRDANAIAKDNDLTRISTSPRFTQIVEKARAIAHLPIAGHPAPTPAFAPFGGTVTLTETNLVFDFETGLYTALVKLTGENAPSPLADRYSASHGDAPERPYLAAWLSEGTASGNGGDVYFNRDRNHSRLNTADFPLLTSVVLAPDAVARNLDTDHPNILFPGRFSFVNASRALTSTPLWRSDARATFTHAGLALAMHRAYMSNQIVFFPAHKDYGVPELGDIFPAAAPFQVISRGSSWSDQPFMRAACAFSAALRPPAKQALLRRHLGATTFQWLLRRTLRGVKSEGDYLSERAHPTVFEAAQLDVKALVERAHALLPAAIPPAVGLSPINSRLFPIPMPVPGRDYPDTPTEFLFATPTAVGMILRGPAAERDFMFQARTLPENDPEATFAWRVVHGPADRVKISTPLGETVNNPAHGLAQIHIDRAGLTNRIDIAVFAQTHGTSYGAPSIISFCPIPLETRVYDQAKRLISIDYSNPANVYCDPLLALPRRWKDTYHYDKNGTCTGFTRSYAGKNAADFTSDGRRIVARDQNGTPSQVVRVKYIPRKTGTPHAPLELTYVDNGTPTAP